MEYKGYEVVTDGRFSLYKIKTIGKGALPHPFRGLFTTTQNAMKAIDMYLIAKVKDKGVVTNGEEEQCDRG